MPIVRRRIVALITIACLGASMPAAVAHAQGAGDQQYTDPFAGSGSNSGSGAGSGSGSGTLSSTPQGSSSSGSGSGASSGSSSSSSSSSTSGAVAGAVAGASASSSPSTAAAPTATTASGLPNTGADARLVLLVGSILVLAGLGLRLRSRPERF